MKLERLSKLSVECKVIMPLLIVAFVVLSMPYLVRGEDNLLIGRESYYYLRIAENPLSNYDELSYGGRFLIFNAYPLILNIAGKIFDVDLINISKILPIFFGIVALLLFYYILRKLGVDKLTTVLASIILIISPPFIYAFSISNVYIIPIILLLLSFLLLLYNKKLLAYGVFFITIFFGVMPFLISSILLVIYLIKSKNYRGLYLLMFMGLFLAPVIKLGMPELPVFTRLPEGINFRAQAFISEFGSEIGLSIFAVVLALFGLKELWQKKYEHLAVYIALVILLILSYLHVKSILYLNFLICLLAAMGIVRLLYQKWDSILINIIIGIMLIMGLISSLIFSVAFLSDSLPNKDIIDSLKYLREESKENAVVFSYYTKGHWINTLSRRKNVMDEGFFYAPNINERYDDSEELFRTRDINNATKIIDKYKIRYIWIDNTMKNGQVWNEDDEGLLFLLGASKKFKREYINDYIEVWKVVG